MATPILTRPNDSAGSDSPQEPTALVPFVRGAREHIEPFGDMSRPLTASTQQIGPIDVPAYGWLRGIYIHIEGTGGAGGAATVAMAADAPWNVLQDLALTDVNGVPLIGPINGYEAYLLHKWGGYARRGDLALSPAYVAPTVGAGGSGNFSLMLYIPVELTRRDGLGSLPNGASNSTYKLSLSLAASSTVYATAPATTLPTIRVRTYLAAWSQPPVADLQGIPIRQEPPAPGTTQFVSRTIQPVAAGEQRIKVTRVGNFLRNIVAVFRDTTGARSNSIIPADYRWEQDGKTVEYTSSALQRHKLAEMFGQAVDTGVLLWPFFMDESLVPGNERRDMYVPTIQSTRLELLGQIGGSGGTVTLLNNDVAPGGNSFRPADAY